MNKNKDQNIVIKAGILSILLILTYCATPTIASNNNNQYQEIADTILTQLSCNQDDYLIYIWGPLPADTEINSLSEKITDTPNTGYILYIDLIPQANFFHPVQYVFYSEETQDLQIFDAQSPPQNFFDYHLVDTALGRIHNAAQNRRTEIPETTNQELQKKGSDSRWAVLMNGGYGSGSNHVRYWNDLSNIYITLNHVYGFLDEQIIVLCSDGLNPAPDQSNGQNSPPDLDGDGDDDIMYSCVLSNVDLVFADLADTLKPNDKLFVFATDHGSSQGGWDTIFNLWNAEELTDDHFAALLAALPNGEVICTFEPCFSGGFLDDVVVPPGPVVASSACRHDEYSWAMPPDYMYDTYVFHWTAAVKGEDAYGVPVDADTNTDGVITMDEAYIYAVMMDTDDENPQYGDYPENIGMELSLWVSNKSPDVPLPPTGPESGIIQEEYDYTAVTTDEEGEQISYLFNWGDGTTSNWIGPVNSGEPVTASHVWIDAGIYNITVKAKDSNDQECDWSDPLIMHMTKPVLELRMITGGLLKVSAGVKNSGEAIGENISWSILLDGGIILMGKESMGTINSLAPGEVAMLSSGVILGFGKTRVLVTVENPLGAFDSRNQGAQLFLFYVYINPGGGI